MSKTDPSKPEQPSAAAAQQPPAGTLTMLARCERLDRIVAILRGLEEYRRGFSLASLDSNLKQLRRDANVLCQAVGSPDIEKYREYRESVSDIERWAARREYGKAREIACRLRQKLVPTLPVLQSEAGSNKSHLGGSVDTPQAGAAKLEGQPSEGDGAELELLSYTSTEGDGVNLDTHPELGAPMIDNDSHLSPNRMAALFGVPLEALRQRLDRWRKKNADGWIENPDRKPREAKYLYRVGAVRPIIDTLKPTSETTGERPAKKK